MNKLLVATSFAVLSSASAHAADLTERPYTKAVPYVEPGHSWTGGYIGVNLGGVITSSPAVNDLAPLGGGAVVLHIPGHLSSAGVIGGAQIGYNWQFAPNWVFGLEADIQGSGQKDGTSATLPTAGGLFSMSLESRLNYFGTARARLGLLATPSLLLYATGGLGWGNTEFNMTSTLAGASSSASFTHTNIGWTVGGGVEGKISANWSAKAEYLYLDLGNTAGSVTLPPVIQTGSVDFRDHIVRIGLNYHFN